MLVQLEFPGELSGKGRPRLGRGVVYTPGKTRKAERDLGWLARAAMGRRRPSKAAIGLSIVIYRNFPKSWPAARRRQAVHATGKPDLDNIAKLVGDAFNSIVWADDSQIVELGISRFFTVLEPKTTICVTELGPAANA